MLLKLFPELRVHEKYKLGSNFNSSSFLVMSKLLSKYLVKCLLSNGICVSYRQELQFSIIYTYLQVHWACLPVAEGNMNRHLFLTASSLQWKPLASGEPVERLACQGKGLLTQNTFFINSTKDNFSKGLYHPWMYRWGGSQTGLHEQFLTQIVIAWAHTNHGLPSLTLNISRNSESSIVLVQSSAHITWRQIKARDSARTCSF